MSAVSVTGDVHGCLEKLHELLQRAGLIDAEDHWAGADSTLWFMGDLVDHGPDGIGVIELVMRLEGQAAEAGGRIGALLGNHDVLLLAAARFGDLTLPGSGKSFRTTWEESGGMAEDLDRLGADHIRWLASRPAMAREGDFLLVHADALLYAGYGSSIVEANEAITALLHGDDPARWGRLLDHFGQHGAFVDARTGPTAVEHFLGRFGGARIVHGHTPISKMTGQPAETVREPLTYAGERCLDVDGGLYLGGPGLVCLLPGVMGAG